MILLLMVLSMFTPTNGQIQMESPTVTTDGRTEKVIIRKVEVTKDKRPRVTPRRISRPRPTPTPTPTLPPGQSHCGYIDIRDLPRICYEDLDPANPQNSIEDSVRRAVRTIGVPALTAKTQPATQALINIPTILYTNASAFTRDVTLLGQTTRIEATPIAYIWHHGDGTKQTTRTPGRAHPHRDVTHTYKQPKNQAKVRVDTVYRIRYRIAGGTWATLGNTLTITGPETELTIVEARPYLTKN